MRLAPRGGGGNCGRWGPRGRLWHLRVLNRRRRGGESWSCGSRACGWRTSGPRLTTSAILISCQAELGGLDHARVFAFTLGRAEFRFRSTWVERNGRVGRRSGSGRRETRIGDFRSARGGDGWPRCACERSGVRAIGTYESCESSFRSRGARWVSQRLVLACAKWISGRRRTGSRRRGGKRRFRRWP